MDVASRLDIAELTGEVIAGYTLGVLLGSGTFGTVYRVTKVERAPGAKARKPRAMKIISRSWMADPATRERFTREFQILESLNHPGVVRYYEDGHDARLNVSYVIMELVDGNTLEQIVAKGDRLPSDQVLSLAVPIAEALAHLHENGIVHRDLKPENVCLGKEEGARRTVKLIDFGISKDLTRTGLTGTEQMLGTPAYMAPEQFGGEDGGPPAVSPATDVWAVGVMLYELLSGIHPFVRPTLSATAVAVCTVEPSPLAADVSAPLRALVTRCLSKARAERPASARELCDALMEVQRPVAPASASTSAEVPTSRRISPTAMDPLTHDDKGKLRSHLSSPPARQPRNGPAAGVGLLATEPSEKPAARPEAREPEAPSAESPRAPLTPPRAPRGVARAVIALALLGACLALYVLWPEEECHQLGALSVSEQDELADAMCECLDQDSMAVNYQTSRSGALRFHASDVRESELDCLRARGVPARSCVHGIWTVTRGSCSPSPPISSAAPQPRPDASTWTPPAPTPAPPPDPDPDPDSLNDILDHYAECDGAHHIVRGRSGLASLPSDVRDRICACPGSETASFATTGSGLWARESVSASPCVLGVIASYSYYPRCTGFYVTTRLCPAP